MPLRKNDGRPVDPEKFEQTLEELLARFGGVSRLPATVRGIWTHKGQRFEDDSLRVFVDVPDTRANRQFFLKLKARLLKRFEQIEIYIASHPIDIL